MNPALSHTCVQILLTSRLYGKEYSKTRQYATKTKGAQEAHEAIRPTYMSNQEIEAGAQEKKLYALIWKRTMASQMADATIQKTEISIGTSAIKNLFLATADRVKFDGFLKIYIESKDDDSTDEETNLLLPALAVNQEMHLQSLRAIEKFSQKPPRYSEASLVKKLEELGIGRPSTYAPTISTIITRGYIVKDNRAGQERQFRELKLEKGTVISKILTETWGAEKNKLFPEDIGILVNDFIVDNFDTIIDYGFTAKVEEDFDRIAEGKLVWNDVIAEFYKPFHKKVEETLLVSRPANAEKVLGTDPNSGKTVSVRIGRFGPLAQIGESDDPDKKFMSLGKGQLIETITLSEALKLFDLPRSVGSYKEKEIVAAIGRFGPYIKYNGGFISIGKDNDPHTIDIDTSIRLIEAHAKKESERLIKGFPEEGIEILNGRFGAYIKKGKENFKIPKGTDPKELDLETTLKLIEKGGKSKK